MSYDVLYAYVQNLYWTSLAHLLIIPIFNIQYGKDREMFKTWPALYIRILDIMSKDIQYGNYEGLDFTSTVSYISVLYIMDIQYGNDEGMFWTWPWPVQYFILDIMSKDIKCGNDKEMWWNWPE